MLMWLARLVQLLAFMLLMLAIALLVPRLLPR
jgi:hypothetical protein